MSRTLGIIILILGILMVAYTGFNYVTKDKVLDVGKLEVNKERSHPVRWSPIVGVILMAGGITILATNKRAKI
jgi:hypothetical protein